MNILAEKQKYMLEKGISKEEYSKRETEFLKLYYELRRKDENKWWSKLTLEQRKSIHWLILQIYKIKNHLGGFSYEIINNKKTKTDRPIIFAITHVGKFVAGMRGLPKNDQFLSSRYVLGHEFLG